MNDQISWHEKVLWYEHLQHTMKKSIQEEYEGRWKYLLSGDKALSIEIGEPEEITILEIVYAEEQEELIIYVKVDEEVKEVWRVQQVIHQMMAAASEAFLVLVPLHTPDALQFWFITGRYSHGHVGRVMIRRGDNPHIEFDDWLKLL